MSTHLEHSIRNRPAYFKQIKEMLEAHELKAKMYILERNFFKIVGKQVTKTSTIDSEALLLIQQCLNKLKQL